MPGGHDRAGVVPRRPRFHHDHGSGSAGRAPGPACTALPGPGPGALRALGGGSAEHDRLAQRDRLTAGGLRDRVVEDVHADGGERQTPRSRRSSAGPSTRWWCPAGPAAGPRRPGPRITVKASGSRSVNRVRATMMMSQEVRNSSWMDFTAATGDAEPVVRQAEHQHRVAQPEAGEHAEDARHRALPERCGPDRRQEQPQAAVAARMIGSEAPTAMAGTIPTRTSPRASDPTMKVGSPSMAGSPPRDGAGVRALRGVRC